MLNRTLSVVEDAIAATAFMVITAVAFANVISRYFLDASLAFTTEITVNLAVWMIMIGAVIGVREGSHLGFTLLLDQARGILHTTLVIVVGVLMGLFFLVLVVYGWDQVLSQMRSGRTTPSMDIPQWWFSLALPVGSVLGILRTAQATVWQLRGEDHHEFSEERSVA